MKGEETKSLRAIAASLRVKPGSTVSLPKGHDPAYVAPGIDEAAAVQALNETTALLAGYQARLAAQDTYGVLVVIQGIDASGKDGSVKHVMSGVNPAGVRVENFKVPSEEEIAHDFLWRYAAKLPRRGQITIFNRSHYEEVLVVKVHPEHLERQRLPRSRRPGTVWDHRYRDINNWEQYLTDNGIRVVKIFLNVSKEEQRQRFLDRINDPSKNWKVSPADIKERQFWDDYQDAFSEMLSKTSTSWAPWHVVPADKKWFARLAVAAVIIDELMRIDPAFPKLTKETSATLATMREQLEREGGPAPASPPRAARSRGLE